MVLFTCLLLSLECEVQESNRVERSQGSTGSVKDIRGCLNILKAMLCKASQLWQRGCEIEMSRYRVVFGENLLRKRDWRRKSNGERLLLCVEWCRVV